MTYLQLIGNHKISSSLWVTDHLRIYSTSSSTTTVDLIPKLYQCDAKHLELKDQTFTLNEFLLFTKFAQGCYLKNVTINDQEGYEIPLEMIVAKLESLRKGFKCEFGPNSINVSSKTVSELIKIPHFKNIQIFTLILVSEAFDIETFFEFLKKNKITSGIGYENMISDAYKSKLEGIITEILETEILDYKPPFIVFEGQDRNNRNALCKLYEER